MRSFLRKCPICKDDLCPLPGEGWAIMCLTIGGICGVAGMVIATVAIILKGQG